FFAIDGQFFEIGANGRQLPGATTCEDTDEIESYALVRLDLGAVDGMEGVEERPQFTFVVEAGDAGDGIGSLLVARAFAGQEFCMERAAGLELEQVVGAKGFVEETGSGLAAEGNLLPVRERFLPVRFERAHRFAANEVEILVGGVVGGDERNFDGL